MDENGYNFYGGDHRRDGCHGPALQRPRNGPISTPRPGWLGSGLLEHKREIDVEVPAKGRSVTTRAPI